jgi:hypothetical protein
MTLRLTVYWDIQTEYLILLHAITSRHHLSLTDMRNGDFTIVRMCTYTNVDSKAYYTPRLYGIAYCS